MLIVGLTGGIGSGKSTVADLFAKLGVPIIDADLIARELTQPDTDAFTKIIAHFGRELLKEDGTLNRPKLRHLIFSHPQEKQWLEELLHPLIREAIIQNLEKLQAPYCIAVIPLLLEAKKYSFIKRILVVDTPVAAQIARVTARDQSEKKQVEAIIKAQVNRAFRLKHAHDIIMNDGVLADLIPQVEKLHQFYLRISSGK